MKGVGRLTGALSDRLRSGSFLLGLVLLSAAAPARTLLGQVAPDSAAVVFFTGGVYESTVDETILPLAGVSVSVHGSNSRYPDPGTLIRSTKTDREGRFELTVSPADGTYRFYHVRETDREGYVSVDARSAEGTVRAENWIEFPALEGGRTFADIRFWDIGPRPDLVLGISRCEITGKGDTLRILVQVWNNGSARAPATLVRASSRDWTSSATVRALDPREIDRVGILFPIPEKRRGEKHTFLVQVDPEGGIAEFNEENNSAETTAIEIPNLPDLVVVSSRAEVSSDSRTVHGFAEIANQGGVAAPQGSVSVSSEGWKGTGIVRPLGVREREQVEIQLTIPIEARGKGHSFVVVVDPEGRIAEVDERNNTVVCDEIRIPSLPDLVVRVPRCEIPEGARSLRILMEIENVGGAPSGPTTVRAASGTWVGTGNVAWLTAGASAIVEITLPIPDGKRGSLHTFAIEVDPDRRVAELSETNNVAQTTPITIADLPDLTVSRTHFEILADAKTLRVEIEVANVGGAPADPTTVRVSSRGWGETAPVWRLAAGATVRIEIRLEIPPARRGEAHAFLVEVDPEGRILELNERNNATDASMASIPQLPDLALEVSRLGFTDKDRSLLIIATVRNAGGASAPACVIRAVSDGWEQRSTLPTLARGDSAHVEVLFVITDERRGRAYSFDVHVDPQDEIRELDERNNVVRTPGIDIPKRRPVPPLVWIGGAVVFLLGVSFLVHLVLKRRRRREWQEDAAEGELPQECRLGTYHCRKIELDLDRSDRKVAYLLLKARRSGSARDVRTRRVEGEIAHRLSEVVAFNRRTEERGGLADRLLPLAGALLREIRVWLSAEAASCDVVVDAHLKGGKARWEFILYHGERKGVSEMWVEDDRWEAMAKDERDVEIGVLRGLDPTGAAGAGPSIEDLTGILARFVREV